MEEGGGGEGGGGGREGERKEEEEKEKDRGKRGGEKVARIRVLYYISTIERTLDN